jgi:hypothetical protein
MGVEANAADELPNKANDKREVATILFNFIQKHPLE